MNTSAMLKDSEPQGQRPTLSSFLPKTPLSPEDAPERATARASEGQTRERAPISANERQSASESPLAKETPGPTREPKEKKERASRLQSVARKLAEEANLLVQVAQREDAKRLAEHERVRAICNTVFGGGLTRLLRESPLLSADDKEFLKELKYI